MAKRDYDKLADIGDYISYDPETGEFRWLQRRSQRSAGRLCGTPERRRRGYLRVGFRKQQLKLHRLAVFLMTGHWPAGQVDHINGVTSDNRWCNLRVTSAGENCRNTARLMANNTSGHRGVQWNKQKGKWMAVISADRKNHYLGFYTDKDAAIAAYEAARPIYHPTFVPRT